MPKQIFKPSSANTLLASKHESIDLPYTDVRVIEIDSGFRPSPCVEGVDSRILSRALDMSIERRSEAIDVRMVYVPINIVSRATYIIMIRAAQDVSTDSRIEAIFKCVKHLPKAMAVGIPLLKPSTREDLNESEQLTYSACLKHAHSLRYVNTIVVG